MLSSRLHIRLSITILLTTACANKVNSEPLALDDPDAEEPITEISNISTCIYIGGLNRLSIYGAHDQGSRCIIMTLIEAGPLNGEPKYPDLILSPNWRLQRVDSLPVSCDAKHFGPTSEAPTTISGEIIMRDYSESRTPLDVDLIMQFSDDSIAWRASDLPVPTTCEPTI